MLQLKQLQDIKENDQVRKQRRSNQIKQNSIIKNKIAMIQQNNINMINKMVSIAEAEKAGRMKAEEAARLNAIAEAEKAGRMKAEEASFPVAQVINKVSVEQPKSIPASSPFAQVINKMSVEQPKSMPTSSMFHQFAQVANKQFI
jgi:hypothetical protein